MPTSGMVPTGRSWIPPISPLNRSCLQPALGGPCTVHARHTLLLRHNVQESLQVDPLPNIHPNQSLNDQIVQCNSLPSLPCLACFRACSTMHGRSLVEYGSDGLIQADKVDMHKHMYGKKVLKDIVCYAKMHAASRKVWDVALQPSYTL